MVLSSNIKFFPSCNSCDSLKRWAANACKAESQLNELKKPICNYIQPLLSEKEFNLNFLLSCFFLHFLWWLCCVKNEICEWYKKSLQVFFFCATSENNSIIYRVEKNPHFFHFCLLPQTTRGCFWNKLFMDEKKEDKKRKVKC